MTNGVSCAGSALERRGRRAVEAHERAPHALGIAESAVPGDLLQRARAAIEQGARGVGPQPLDRLGRGYADLLMKDACEVARTHAGLRREALDAELSSQGRAHVLEQRRKLPVGAL